MRNILQRFSIKISTWSGSTTAFVLANVLVLIWLALGPYFRFSSTWLIVITVITDIVIFIMVFSIQNTQARDSKAIQLKLNELIVADKKARDAFIGLETLTDAELAQLDEEFKRLFETLEVTPAMRKLHQKVSHEKAHRFSLYEQAGKVVDTLFSNGFSNHPARSEHASHPAHKKHK